MDDRLVNGVLYVRARVCNAKESRRIGFVIGVQTLRCVAFNIEGQVICAESFVCCDKCAVAASTDIGPSRGFLLNCSPGPGVTKP